MVKFVIFLAICTLFSICIDNCERRKQKKREMYDFIVQYVFKKYAENSEIPIFMNSNAYKMAHKYAIYITQQGALDKCYMMCKAGTL